MAAVGEGWFFVDSCLALEPDKSKHCRRPWALSFVTAAFLVTTVRYILRICFLFQVVLTWTYMEPVGRWIKLNIKMFYALVWPYFFLATVFLHGNEALSWKWCFNWKCNSSKRVSLRVSLVLRIWFKTLCMPIKVQWKTCNIYWKCHK